MGIYRQGEKQNEINETLLKKDDVYITNNYSLIDIGNRITTFNCDEDIVSTTYCSKREAINFLGLL